MYNFSCKALVLAFLTLDVFSVVQAAIYVIQPAQGSVCHGGQECTIQWVEDGDSPLLSAIQVVTIGLYTGDMQLVQSIPAANVAEAQSVTFTPIPEAGPNSAKYYIALTSTSVQVNDSPYVGYSPFFQLDGMSGSFDSPLESATSSIPIPSSLTETFSQATGVTSTRTIGTLSTSLSPLPTSNVSSVQATSSGFSTSASSRLASTTPSSGPPSSSASASASADSSSSNSNGAGPIQTADIPLPIAIGLSLFVFFHAL